jgi:hypothetical protein
MRESKHSRSRNQDLGGVSTVAEAEMDSRSAFLAHRLGSRHVDCDKCCGCGTASGEVVARDDDVHSETGRRWCTDSEGKHTWRRRCDVLSVPRIRSTTPPPNSFREPPTPTSQTPSSFRLLSAPLLQAQQKATRASFASCSPPQGAGRTLPLPHEEPKSGHPHCGTSYSQEVAKLSVFHSVSQHSSGAREDSKTHCCMFPFATCSLRGEMH